MSDTIATEMALAAAKSPPVEAAAFRLSAGRKGSTPSATWPTA